MSMTEQTSSKTDAADDRAARQLAGIRELLASDVDTPDEILDRIADIVGDRRKNRPVYQKALG